MFLSSTSLSEEVCSHKVLSVYSCVAKGVERRLILPAEAGPFPYERVCVYVMGENSLVAGGLDSLVYAATPLAE